MTRYKKIGYNIFNRILRCIMGAIAGGCGSVIGGGFVILMVAVLAIGALILKKSKSENE